jgi:hydroxypyruvate reductase
MTDYRGILLELYAAGLAAVHGEWTVYQTLQKQSVVLPYHVIAIGKAAEAMLLGAQRYLQNQLQSALVITKYAHSTDKIQHLANVSVIEAGHPVPDENSLKAGAALLRYLQELPAEASLLFLISGGASSLVEVLEASWDLNKLQATTQTLLANGSTIEQINTIRRQASAIKGGKLWNYIKNHKVNCLLLSDVSSNDEHVIGSGLLFPFPKQVDFSWQLVATNQHMLQAIQAKAASQGWHTHLVPEFLQGEATNVAENCIEYLRNNRSGVYIWGAETTVTLPAKPGRGGRNQHLALAVALALQADDSIYLLAAGSDGTDGMTDDAGAVIDQHTLQRGHLANLSPKDCLNRADSGTFLAASGDLIHVGATGTNVMDVIIGLKL